MSSCYIYVVARDFGFAPNPFHGICTLATCKPGIRSRAEVGDWVVGVGGSRLNATGCCIYAMHVTDALSFDEYWESDAYRDKRPVRNGSAKMMVGDNIYHRDPETGDWAQEDSHHSNPDGTPNPHNINHDTKANRVLLSDDFVYFGEEAPEIPSDILETMGYRNVRNYRVFRNGEWAPLIDWIRKTYFNSFGRVMGDPFDFSDSARRYSVRNDEVQ